MNALVIDDSRVMRSILRNILCELGYTVHEAVNGREGLDALGRMPDPAIVFVDWNMPVMNGLEFVSKVREESSKAGLPIVMVTTEVEMDAVSRALELGASEYIMKPFDREIVREKLELLGIAVA